MAGALLTVITAVVILIGILVCCKRRVKTDTAKEHQCDYATTTESEELVYDYASTLSADGLYPVPSIKTSTNGKIVHS